MVYKHENKKKKIPEMKWKLKPEKSCENIRFPTFICMCMYPKAVYVFDLLIENSFSTFKNDWTPLAY